jgi:hypothetical protein
LRIKTDNVWQHADVLSKFAGDSGQSSLHLDSCLLVTLLSACGGGR